MMKTRLMICALAALPVLTWAQAPAHKPDVWIGPPGVLNGKALRDLFEHPDEWKQTRSMVDGILYADHLLKQFSDDDLRRWLGMLREWKLGLMFEVGAVKPWGQTGDVTFNRQRPIWDRVQNLGGKIYAVAMDEPLICVRKDLKKTDDYAVEETAKFIALARQRYPDMLIGDTETFPSIPLKDHYWWIETLNAKLREKGVRGLDFYRLDVNWMNFVVQQQGGWRDVRQLEQYCRAHHLPFSLIYWPSGLPGLQHLGRCDESTWYVSIMEQAQNYLMVGGAPDQYVIESWVGEPPNAVPETADWTFTRSVRDFVERFVKPAKPPQAPLK